MFFARYDRDGNQLAPVPEPTKARLLRNVNGKDQLTLAFRNADAIDFGDRITLLDSMGEAREYIAQSPQLIRADGRPYLTVVCNGSMAELEGKGIKDKRNRSATATSCLTKALEGTRWKVGSVEGSKTADLSFYDTNALQAVQDICDTYGLEAVASYTADDDHVTGRTLSLLERQGRDTGILRRFEYAADLSSIQRTYSAGLVYTRVHGRGKGLQDTDTGETGDADKDGYKRKLTFEDINNGKDYVEDVEATERWGVLDADGMRQPVECYYENTQCEDKQQLLDETRDYLDKVKVPQITYEADVTAFARAGLDVDGIALGDKVQLVDQPSGIRVEGRVTELDENLLDPSDTKLTLGSIIEPFTLIDRRVQETVQELMGSRQSWDDAASLTPSYVDGVIAGLNAQMNATGGYTYFVPNEGVYVYDKPRDANPTMVIHIGGGFMRIANSRQSNGEWAWRTMGTGAGLVADTIVTGLLKGGKSWWNLNTGEVNFESGVIHNTSNTVSINLTTGEVILRRGRISDGGGNSWDLTNGGGITITDGSISISGYVDGRRCTTTIDASGFNVTGGNGGGTMTDNNGNVALRSSTLGPDDNNYLKVGGSNALQLYNSGRELFTIQGGTSYSSLFQASALGNQPFLEVGDDPQGQSGSTVIHTASGQDYPCIGISPSASYMLLNGNAYIVASDSGWAGVYGIDVGNHGYDIYAQDSSIQMLTPSHNARIDLTNNYSALVYRGYHVMVSADGVGTVTKATSASIADTGVLDSRLMTLADEGLDLDSPDAYATMPAGIEEIPLGKLHDVLRLLVDGDTAGAKILLDQYESEQRIWTQADYDAMNIPTPSASLSLK